MDHMGPPCEGSVRCEKHEYLLCLRTGIEHTLMQPFSMSHSTSSLPPPALNSLRFDHEGTSSSDARLGERKVSASDSTFEGYGPIRVYQETFPP